MKRKRVTEGPSKKCKGLIENLDELECPICKELPQGDIYSCSDGHSVCKKCVERSTCLQCRGPRTRNRYAEILLDNLQFFCLWREQGCDREGLNRQQLAKHARFCLFNPDSIPLCQMLCLKTDCFQKVSPEFLRPPFTGIPHNYSNHLREAHQLAIEKKLVSKTSYTYSHTKESMKLILDGKQNSLCYGNMYVLTVKNCTQNPFGLFITYCYCDSSELEQTLSWFVVRVTQKPDSLSASVRFALESDSVDKTRQPCVRTEWDGKIMSLHDFHEFSDKPERSKLKFHIPLSRLKEYYFKPDGGLDLEFTFTVSMDEEEGSEEI